jgi:peptidoglycan/LPS O-acetylase OafA/YrhL
VEEQFYLLWPSLAKAGGTKLLKAVSVALIPTSLAVTFVLAMRHSDPFAIWVNSFVQFLYFATGALLALTLHGRAPQIKTWSRLMMGAAGLTFWLISIHFGFLTAFSTAGSAAQEMAGYGVADLGCVLIFLACLGVPGSHVPGKITYLGKISYGLYVFHFGLLLLIELCVTHNLEQWTRMLVVDSAALMGSVALSMLSYQYFEKPFLVMKKRFEFIRSRPA